MPSAGGGSDSALLTMGEVRRSPKFLQRALVEQNLMIETNQSVSDDLSTIPFKCSIFADMNISTLLT